LHHILSTEDNKQERALTKDKSKILLTNSPFHDEIVVYCWHIYEKYIFTYRNPMSRFLITMSDYKKGIILMTLQSIVWKTFYLKLSL